MLTLELSSYVLEIPHGGRDQNPPIGIAIFQVLVVFFTSYRCIVKSRKRGCFLNFTIEKWLWRGKSLTWLFLWRFEGILQVKRDGRIIWREQRLRNGVLTSCGGWALWWILVKCPEWNWITCLFFSCWVWCQQTFYCQHKELFLLFPTNLNTFRPFRTTSIIDFSNCALKEDKWWKRILAILPPILGHF